MEVKEYSNIIEDIDKVKALKRKEEFYSENGVYDSSLNNYKMLEFFSINPSLNEDVIDKVLKKAISNYLNSYFFYISHADYKTRNRSYKGYINTNMLNPIKEFKEQEVDIENNMSFFIGIINLKPNYQNIFDNLFFESSRRFVFCTNDYIKKDDLICKLLSSKGLNNLCFNYYYLIQTFIQTDEIIIRAAGSDIENGVQVFEKKKRNG